MADRAAPDRLVYRAGTSPLGSKRSSADLVEMGVALIAPAWSTARLGPASLANAPIPDNAPAG